MRNRFFSRWIRGQKWPIVALVSWLVLGFFSLRYANATVVSIISALTIVLFAVAGLTRLYGTSSAKNFASGFAVTGLGYLLLNHCWAEDSTLSGPEDSITLHCLERVFRVWYPNVDDYLGMPSCGNGYHWGPTIFHRSFRSVPVVGRHDRPSAGSNSLQVSTQVELPDNRCCTGGIDLSMISKNRPQTVTIPEFSYLGQTLPTGSPPDPFGGLEIYERIEGFPAIGQRLFMLLFGLVGGIYAQRMERRHSESGK